MVDITDDFWRYLWIIFGNNALLGLTVWLFFSIVEGFLIATIGVLQLLSKRETTDNLDKIVDFIFKKIMLRVVLPLEIFCVIVTGIAYYFME